MWHRSLSLQVSTGGRKTLSGKVLKQYAESCKIPLPASAPLSRAMGVGPRYSLC